MKKRNGMNQGVAILLLAASHNIIYGTPYMRDVFYDLMASAMNLNHYQIGMVCSGFGITATISYLFGGVVADRFSLKKQMIFSLVIMGILNMLMAFNLGYQLSVILMGMMGIFSVLTFYPALMKMISIIGGENEQGKAYGLFNAGNYFVGAVFFAICVLQVTVSENSKMVFWSMVGLYGISCFACAFCVWRYVPETVCISEVCPGNKNDRMKEDYKELLKSATVWKIAGIVLTSYFIGSGFAYINPYMIECLGIGKNIVYIMGILRTNVLVILVAPVVGRIVDLKKSALPMLKGIFIVSSFSLLILGCIYCVKEIKWISVILLLIISVGITSSKTIAYIPIKEMDIPIEIQGTVIGIVSFVGYLPDSFYYSVMGKIIDLLGSEGYQIMFWISTVVGIVGAICAGKLKKVEA